jgi:pimeloyl-ACP methyl ester carboxylesterase
MKNIPSDGGLVAPASHTDFPDWFAEARLRHPGRYGFVDHEGCAIAYQTWGRPGLPPMLMLHGAGASSEWWEATALLLAERFHIVAPSFAGTGRSGWRETYSVAQSAQEGLACARAEFGEDARPICVAHSFGSEAGFQLAIDPARPISHLVLVDTLTGLHGDAPRSFPRRERVFYPTMEDAAGRFTTVPRDDFGPKFLREHVAQQSVERVERQPGEYAWTWRADPNLMASLPYASVFGRIGEALCPVDFVWGGLSSMNSAQLLAKQAQTAPEGSRFHEIAEAGHHIPLDTPAQLASAVEHLVATIPTTGAD